MQFQRGTFQLLTEGFLGDIRLPRHLTPTAYDVELMPFIEEGNFTTDGSVRLHADFNDSVENGAAHNKIYMHVKQIAIDEGSVYVENVLVSRLLITRV